MVNWRMLKKQFLARCAEHRYADIFTTREGVVLARGHPACACRNATLTHTLACVYVCVFMRSEDYGLFSMRYCPPPRCPSPCRTVYLRGKQFTHYLPTSYTSSRLQHDERSHLYILWCEPGIHASASSPKPWKTSSRVWVQRTAAATLILKAILSYLRIYPAEASNSSCRVDALITATRSTWNT
jgi:hypothetical protein